MIMNPLVIYSGFIHASGSIRRLVTATQRLITPHVRQILDTQVDSANRRIAVRVRRSIEPCKQSGNDERPPPRGLACTEEQPESGFISNSHMAS